MSNRIVLDMDASELEKYIIDTITRVAERHDGFTRLTLGEYTHAMVVSWQYRGSMDDARSADLDNVLSGFTAIIAESLADEIIAEYGESE
jgi:hypothetical protein